MNPRPVQSRLALRLTLLAAVLVLGACDDTFESGDFADAVDDTVDDTPVDVAPPRESQLPGLWRWADVSEIAIGNDLEALQTSVLAFDHDLASSYTIEEYDDVAILSGWFVKEERCEAPIGCDVLARRDEAYMMTSYVDGDLWFPFALYPGEADGETSLYQGMVGSFGPVVDGSRALDEFQLWTVNLHRDGTYTAVHERQVYTGVPDPEISKIRTTGVWTRNGDTLSLTDGETGTTTVRRQRNNVLSLDDLVFERVTR